MPSKPPDCRSRPTVACVRCEPNSLKGADIDEGTLDIGDAARAYVHMNPFTCMGTPGTCDARQSKGVSSVTRFGVGQYCVTAPGIDPHVTPASSDVGVLVIDAADRPRAVTRPRSG